jgi:hypothetical protein
MKAADTSSQVTIVRAIQTRRDDAVQDRTSKTPASEKMPSLKRDADRMRSSTKPMFPGSGYAAHDRRNLEE